MKTADPAIPELTATLGVIRRWLVIVLLVGLAGTVVELFLLKHTDGVSQLAPVVLMAVAIPILGWSVWVRSFASVRVLQVVMALLVLCGVVGVILHFSGNLGYERESNPSLSGVELYRSALLGSTPALAPGALIPLGMIGLLLTFRHPALARSKRGEDSPETRNTP
jgi:hypothetical protein